MVRPRLRLGLLEIGDVLVGIHHEIDDSVFVLDRVQVTSDPRRPDGHVRQVEVLRGLLRRVLNRGQRHRFAFKGLLGQLRNAEVLQLRIGQHVVVIPNLRTFFFADAPVKTVYPLGYDTRHALNAAFDLRYGAGQGRTGR